MTMQSIVGLVQLLWALLALQKWFAMDRKCDMCKKYTKPRDGMFILRNKTWCEKCTRKWYKKQEPYKKQRNDTRSEAVMPVIPEGDDPGSDEPDCSSNITDIP
jgi:hypothetical protein